MRADVVFYSGLMLEGRMGTLFSKLSRTRRVEAVTANISEDFVLKAEGHHPDPHVWMDAACWGQGIQHIARVLGDFDPQGREEYEANAAAFVGELERLDAYARQVFSSIPAERRVLVTAHDAFGYLGRAYGIEVHGIQGLSTESEAGLRDVNRLVDLLIARKIPAIFVETSVSDKNVKALLEGARSRGWDVQIGASLYSDSMGPAGAYEGTYVGMIDHNVTLIARALGGEAPEGGMNGKLGIGIVGDPDQPTSVSLPLRTFSKGCSR